MDMEMVGWQPAASATRSDATSGAPYSRGTYREGCATSSASVSEEPGGSARDCDRCARCGKDALKSSKSFPSGFWELVLRSGQPSINHEVGRDARMPHGSSETSRGQRRTGCETYSLSSSKQRAEVVRIERGRDEVGGWGALKGGSWVDETEQLPHEKSSLRSSHSCPGPVVRRLLASDGARDY